MALFKRCYKLTLTINGKTKIYQELATSDVSLKIEFEVTASVNGAFSNGIITIFGLKQEDTAFLATNYNPQTLQLKDSFVELEAGYPEQMAMILSGNIYESEPNFTSADQSIRFKVMSGVQNNLKKGASIADSISKNATFKDICTKVASNNNLALKYDNKIPNKVIGDFAFQGTPYQQVMKLRELMPLSVNIAINNKTLEVTYTNSSSAKKMVISGDSGMIGTPKPTSTGCIVTILLNPTLSINTFVEIQSKKLPQLNELYRIIEVKHRGGNRSDNWHTELTLTKAI